MSTYERPAIEPIGSVHELTQNFVIVKRGWGLDRRGKCRKLVHRGS